MTKQVRGTNRSTSLLRRMLPIATVLLVAAVLIAPVAAENVATIDGNDYESLQDAISAAENGETITLLADCTINMGGTTHAENTINLPNGVILDLNSKTLTIPFQKTLFAGTDITIKNGTITTGALESYGLYLMSGSFTIENVTTTNGINVQEGTVTLERVDVTNPNNRYYAVYAGANADVTILSGTYQNPYNGKGHSVLYADGKITVYGGSFDKLPEAKYVAEGYAAFENDDGTYTVAEAYTVTFIDKSGIINLENQVVKTDGTTKLNLVDKTQTGYTFAGWTVTEDGTVAEFKNGATADFEDGIVKDGKVTLYAVWTPNTYTIMFDSNAENTEGSMDVLSATYDVAVQLTSNSFKNGGSNFAGWATSEDGEVAYADGATVKNLASEGDVTLYANWTKKAILTPDLTPQTKSYTGLEQAFTTVAGIQVSYEQNGSPVEKPINVGTYTVVLSAAETETTAAYPETIIEDGLIIEAVEYEITADSSKTVEIGSDAVFTSPAPFADFEKVQVNGNDVASENYDVKEGSTIVTLKASYISTLPTGSHTITIVSKGGSASTQFTVVTKNTGNNPGTGSSPSSGSSSSGSSVWLQEPVAQQPTQTPTETEKPTDTVPTDIPSTQPTATPASPGFGILAALAGLGAVAALRRQ